MDTTSCQHTWPPSSFLHRPFFCDYKPYLIKRIFLSHETKTILLIIDQQKYPRYYNILHKSLQLYGFGDISLKKRVLMMHVTMICLSFSYCVHLKKRLLTIKLVRQFTQIMKTFNLLSDHLAQVLSCLRQLVEQFLRQKGFAICVLPWVCIQDVGCIM